MATKKEAVLKSMDRSALIAYLMVGNTAEDLAEQLIEKLSAVELYEIKSSDSYIECLQKK